MHRTLLKGTPSHTLKDLILKRGASRTRRRPTQINKCSIGRNDLHHHTTKRIALPIRSHIYIQTSLLTHLIRAICQILSLAGGATHTTRNRDRQPAPQQQRVS
jgi:hypothetical protein